LTWVITVQVRGYAVTVTARKPTKHFPRAGSNMSTALVERNFLQSPEIRQRKPFAFDLQPVLDYISLQGKAYQDNFYKEARFYAKEVYGRVKISDIYEHDVKEDGRLFIPSLDKTALQSYGEPLYDPTLPTWYRQRAQKDSQWVNRLEEKIKTAHIGDIFIDVSPTEFDVSYEERKKWGYGWHSFLRIHQVAEEEGERKILSRAIRIYLDPKRLSELFAVLTGEQVEASSLLGKLSKLDWQLNPQLDGLQIANTRDLLYFHDLAEKLYDQTPNDERIIPPEEDKIFTANQVMDRYLELLKPWLGDIFDEMFSGARTDETKTQFKQRALRMFQGWEKAMRALVYREERFQPQLQSLQSNINLVHDYQIKESFMQEQYIMFASACGAGSGFGKSNSSPFSSIVNRVSENMSYSSMSSQTESTKLLCVTCPFCKEEVDADIVNDGNGKIICCPNCGETAPYS